MKGAPFMRHGTLVIACLVVAPLAVAAAQESPSLKPGDRVRVSAPTVPGGPFVGMLATLSADSLVVQSSEGARYLSLASVQQVEISRGTRAHVGMGAGIGFLVGAALGAAIAAGECEQFSDDTGLGRGTCFALAIGGFGAAGTLVGLVTGALIRTDRWEQVPPGRIQMSMTPDRGRALTVGLSLSF